MNPGGPGWNDPPSLSYETHTQTTGRRNMLTKRVGLPDLKIPEARPSVSPSHKLNAQRLMPPPCPPCNNAERADPSKSSSGKSSSNEVKCPQTLPPGVAIFNPLETPLRSACVPSKTEKSAESEDSTHRTQTAGILNPVTSDNLQEDEKAVSGTLGSELEIELKEIDFVKELQNTVHKCQDKHIISNQAAQSILKKIEILEKQRNGEKLPETVVTKMESLTKNMMAGRFDDAWSVHLALICDHSSSVMQWMVGVKRLISEARKL